MFSFKQLFPLANVASSKNDTSGDVTVTNDASAVKNCYSNMTFDVLIGNYIQENTENYDKLPVEVKNKNHIISFITQSKTDFYDKLDDSLKNDDDIIKAFLENVDKFDNKNIKTSNKEIALLCLKKGVVPSLEQSIIGDEKKKLEILTKIVEDKFDDIDDEYYIKYTTEIIDIIKTKEQVLGILKKVLTNVNLVGPLFKKLVSLVSIGPENVAEFINSINDETVINLLVNTILNEYPQFCVTILDSDNKKMKKILRNEIKSLNLIDLLQKDKNDILIKIIIKDTDYTLERFQRELDDEEVDESNKDIITQRFKHLKSEVERQKRVDDFKKVVTVTREVVKDVQQKTGNVVENTKSLINETTGTLKENVQQFQEDPLGTTKETINKTKSAFTDGLKKTLSYFKPKQSGGKKKYSTQRNINRKKKASCRRRRSKM